MKKIKALSIVYPGGQKIASGLKTIEVEIEGDLVGHRKKN